MFGQQFRVSRPIRAFFAPGVRNAVLIIRALTHTPSGPPSVQVVDYRSGPKNTFVFGTVIGLDTRNPSPSSERDQPSRYVEFSMETKATTTDISIGTRTGQRLRVRKYRLHVDGAAQAKVVFRDV